MVAMLLDRIMAAGRCNWRQQVDNHHSIIWRYIMSKERKSHREEKKKAVMTPKEKKAAKKSRKESRGLLGERATR